LVNGELVMSPKNNFQHEFIVARIYRAMANHNEKARLGAVVGSNLGFWMQNRNCRAPDVAFISAARLKALGFTPHTRRFFPEAPDLGIEVLSRGNTRAEIDARLRDFFASGCKLFWVVDPFEEFAEVCHSPVDRKLVGPDGELDGEEIFPGFKYKVADLFRDSDWT
jgi:Uma2 family endonuclease